MTPVSYQGPRADADGQSSHSQDADFAKEAKPSETTVGQILSSKNNDDVFSITSTMSLAAAVTELNLKHIGILPVIDARGNLAGVLSERDIVKAMANADDDDVLSQQVSAHMTPNPKTCSSEDRIVDLMQIMTEGRFRHMPVMDGGALIGMISIRDLVGHRVKELEYEAVRLKQLMVG